MPWSLGAGRSLKPDLASGALVDDRWTPGKADLDLCFERWSQKTGHSLKWKGCSKIGENLEEQR